MPSDYTTPVALLGLFALGGFIRIAWGVYRDNR